MNDIFFHSVVRTTQIHLFYWCSIALSESSSIKVFDYRFMRSNGNLELLERIIWTMEFEKDPIHIYSILWSISIDSSDKRSSSKKNEEELHKFTGLEQFKSSISAINHKKNVGRFSFHRKEKEKRIERSFLFYFYHS